MSRTSAERQQRGRLTVTPQLAYKAFSRAGRGLFLAFLQASDQKVSVLEDMGCRGEKAETQTRRLLFAADATRA
jgi:hypothetical protein